MALGEEEEEGEGVGSNVFVCTSEHLYCSLLDFGGALLSGWISSL